MQRSRQSRLFNLVFLYLSHSFIMHVLTLADFARLTVQVLRKRGKRWGWFNISGNVAIFYWITLSRLVIHLWAISSTSHNVNVCTHKWTSVHHSWITLNQTMRWIRCVEDGVYWWRLEFTDYSGVASDFECVDSKDLIRLVKDYSVKPYNLLVFKHFLLLRVIHLDRLPKETNQRCSQH